MVERRTREPRLPEAENEQGSRRDEMREDYALDEVPASKRWSSSHVLMALVGIITALFFPATGGQYLLAYGATATLVGLAVGFVLMTLLVYVTTAAVSRAGLTSDLLTRGCGYGYLGSALTSLIYAFTFVIYAGLEGQILASAAHAVWPIPMGVYYVVIGLVFIPLTWYGMTQLTWINWVTLPVYLILLGMAIAKGVHISGGFPAHFLDAEPKGSVVGVLGLLGVLAGLSGTIGLNPMEYADYNRFIKPSQLRRATVTAVVLPSALMFFVAFPLGIFFTLVTHSTNPGAYFIALLGTGLGALLVWVAQIRISAAAVYSGSLAFSNFFARAFNLTPGRIWWVALTSLLSIALMFGDVLNRLLVFLEWNGVYLLAWVATVVVDLLVVKKLLRIGPAAVEYRKDRLRLVNPVGVVALLVAVAVGSYLLFGVDDPYLRSLAPWISFGIAAVVHVTMAVATRGRFYLKKGLS